MDIPFSVTASVMALATLAVVVAPAVLPRATCAATGPWTTAVVGLALGIVPADGFIAGRASARVDPGRVLLERQAAVVACGPQEVA
jgi:hypothetical protein